MSDRVWSGRLLVLPILVVMLTALAWAAPFLQPTHRLPDQVRSLARLEAITLRIDLSPELEKHHITAERFLKRWRPRLAEAGFEVREEADAATLRLSVSAVADPDIHGVVAFTPYLTLEQTARVNGLEGDLRLPTYVDILVGLVHVERENLEASVVGALDDMFNRFLQMRDEARRESVSSKQ